MLSSITWPLLWGKGWRTRNTDIWHRQGIKLMSRKGTQDGRTQSWSVNLVSGWKKQNTRLRVRVINSKTRDDWQFYCREALWYAGTASKNWCSISEHLGTLTWQWGSQGHHIRRAAKRLSGQYTGFNANTNKTNKTTTKHGSLCLYSQHSGGGDRRSEVQGQPWAMWDPAWKTYCRRV